MHHVRINGSLLHLLELVFQYSVAVFPQAVHDHLQQLHLYGV